MLPAVEVGGMPAHVHRDDGLGARGDCGAQFLRVEIEIVFQPAGDFHGDTAGQDDGADVDVQGLGLHVQFDGFVLACLFALLAAVAAAHALVDDVFLRKGHIIGQIGRFGLVQTVVEIVDPPLGAGFCTGMTRHATIIDVARVHLDGDVEITGAAADLGNFRHGIKSDVGIFFDPAKVDFQTAGGRAELGKISVELGNPAAQVGGLLGDDYLRPGFRRLQGRGEAADASPDDQNLAIFGVHTSPPWGR